MVRKSIIVSLFLALNLAFAIGYTPPVDKLPPLAGPPDAVAWGLQIMQGGVEEAGAECTYVGKEEQTSDDSNAIWGITSSYRYVTGEYTAADSDPVYKVKVKLNDGAGSPTWTITAALCTDGNPYPDSCTDADSTRTADEVSGITELEFEWAAGFANTVSSDYYIRLHCGTIDVSNYLNVRYNNGGSSYSVSRSDDGINWNDWATGDSQIAFDICK